ncbi:histidine phosphatase family protein [Acetobacter sp.]|uniref:histidine phosphatase family protein n=1 Tax=Acetobacter sp. TaxID=440 RepID=UPI0039E9A27C
MRVVCLARHPAVQVPKGICYGQTDVTLAPGWEGFAHKLAEQMRMDGISRLIASPFARCRLPAEMVQRLTGCDLRLDDRLLEMNFGAWEGRSWNDVPRDALDAWATDLFGFVPPAGESGISLIQRVEAFWSEYRGEGCAILSHGGPLRVLLSLAERRTPDLADPAPALGSILTVKTA